jgi:hypothetical protein
VGLQGQEVELVRVSTHQGLVIPLQGEPWVGERCQTDESSVRLANDARAGRGHKFDNPDGRPSNAPQGEASRVIGDFLRQLEVVLQGVT